MYVYTTKSNPYDPLFTTLWNTVKEVKSSGQLVFLKQVGSEAEGVAYVEAKKVEQSGKSSVKKEPYALEVEPRKWCAARETLTVYRNDRGFFTRKSKKVGEDWKTFFIPVYFSDRVVAPADQKVEITALIHWVLTGRENLKLAITIDKIYDTANEQEEVPF